MIDPDRPRGSQLGFVGLDVLHSGDQPVCNLVQSQVTVQSWLGLQVSCVYTQTRSFSLRLGQVTYKNTAGSQKKVLQ